MLFYEYSTVCYVTVLFWSEERQKSLMDPVGCRHIIFMIESVIIKSGDDAQMAHRRCANDLLAFNSVGI